MNNFIQSKRSLLSHQSSTASCDYFSQFNHGAVIVSFLDQNNSLGQTCHSTELFLRPSASAFLRIPWRSSEFFRLHSATILVKTIKVVSAGGQCVENDTCAALISTRQPKQSARVGWRSKNSNGLLHSLQDFIVQCFFFSPPCLSWAGSAAARHRDKEPGGDRTLTVNRGHAGIGEGGLLSLRIPPHVIRGFLGTVWWEACGLF